MRCPECGYAEALEKLIAAEASKPSLKKEGLRGGYWPPIWFAICLPVLIAALGFAGIPAFDSDDNPMFTWLTISGVWYLLYRKTRRHTLHVSAVQYVGLHFAVICLIWGAVGLSFSVYWLLECVMAWDFNKGMAELFVASVSILFLVWGMLTWSWVSSSLAR